MNTVAASRVAVQNHPRAEYEARRAARRTVETRFSRQNDRISAARLVVFLATVLAAYLAFGRGLFAASWLVFPAAVFVGLLAWHEQTLRARDRAGRAVQFYEKGLNRLDDRWAGTGTPGTRFADPDHPYTNDLDIFGRGSLFERLCLARTWAGENTLGDWLRGGALGPTVGDVRARQEAVRDLRPRLDLREELSLIGDTVRGGAGATATARQNVRPDELVAWGDAPAVPALVAPGTRITAGVLALLAVVTALGWALLGWGAAGFYLVLLAQGAFLWRLRAHIAPVVRAAERVAPELVLLAGLLARLENESFNAPRLRALQVALLADSSVKDGATSRPSLVIARLERWTDLLTLRQSTLLAPLLGILLWTPQLAFAIEAWRQTHGRRIGEWLQATGEWEALASLATYAYENPGDPFPELVEATGESAAACFDAAGLAHPLLPAGRAVANDVCLGAGNGPSSPRLLLVSGSNMSGKSTFLRTIGVNTVLALAGAPVRAERLRLSPLQVGASLQTRDSLQTGVSRFYAEIIRLKQIVDLAGRTETGAAPPLLFLLDEILSGTNSEDRQIGAEAIVRTLAGRGALGLVTTHDLALSRIADDPALAAVNVHFEDRLSDSGEVTFDYRLRPGVVTRSNALALMRAIGLGVDTVR